MKKIRKQFDGSLPGSKNWLAAPVLLFYLASFQVEIIHTFIHANDNTFVLHTPEEEKDLCHRSLFHNEKDACNHESHFIKNLNCQVCHACLKTTHLPGKVFTPTVFFTEAESVGDSFRYFSRYSDRQSARAPPQTSVPDNQYPSTCLH